MDRYRYLIDLGKKLPPMDADHRVEDNLVRGCQSQVWLVRDEDEVPGRLAFRADSDAHIVRGLVAVLLILFNGRTPQEIVATDHGATFEALGLTRHLSQSRTNGLFSMVAKIKAMAEASGDA